MGIPSQKQHRSKGPGNCFHEHVGKIDMVKIINLWQSRVEIDYSVEVKI